MCEARNGLVILDVGNEADSPERRDQIRDIVLNKLSEFGTLNQN